jgi:hypothetical protein
MDDTKLAKAVQQTVSLADVQQEKLRVLEDELLEQSLEVVGGTCSFAELDPEKFDKIPQKWVDDMGMEKAAKFHRLAKAGWLPAKDAPVAITTATKVVSSIVRARATEKAGPKSLNMNIVQLSAPLPDFEVVDVEDDGIE